jgi:hypothetical protein
MLAQNVLEPPTSPKTGASYTGSTAEKDSSDNISRLGTPEFTLDVDAPSQDDTAAKLSSRLSVT